MAIGNHDIPVITGSNTAGIRTLRDVCADENGSDWQENVEQRAVELKFFTERNMTPPDWAVVGASLKPIVEAE